MSIHLRRANKDEILDSLRMICEGLFYLFKFGDFKDYCVDAFGNISYGKSRVRKYFINRWNVNRGLGRMCKNLNGKEYCTHKILREISFKYDDCCLF